MMEGIRNRKLKVEEIAEFCGHVGAMTGAGVPLARAMEILQAGTENKRIQNVYEQLKDAMQTGRSFSSALEDTNAFPELLLNMFLAAEAGGHLDETANRMAIYYRKEHRMRSQIQTAMLYPKILAVVSIFIAMCVLTAEHIFFVYPFYNIIHIMFHFIYLPRQKLF